MDNDFNKITFVGVLAAALCLVFKAAFGVGILSEILLAIVITAGAIVVNLLAEGFWCSFSYMLITSAYPLVMIALTKVGLHEEELGIYYHEAALAVLVPVLIAGAQALYNRDVERNGFDSFFKEQLMYLVVLYGVYTVYTVFMKNMASPVRYQFIPFATFAGYIEAVINKTISADLLAAYLSLSILTYVPYGYLVSAFAEKLLWPIRLGILLALPVAAELIQLAAKKNMCDIDDMFFGFVGALIGAGIWKLLNALFFAVVNRGCMGQTKSLDL